MNNSSLNVNVRTTDPKIVKKLRKAVEKIPEQEKAADENLSYSIDSSYSNGVRTCTSAVVVRTRL